MSNNLRGTARNKAVESADDLGKITDGGIGKSVAAGTNQPDPEAVAEIAIYIAQMTAELCRLAGAARLETLAYFLSMARLEAEMASRTQTMPGKSIARFLET